MSRRLIWWGMVWSAMGCVADKDLPAVDTGVNATTDPGLLDQDGDTWTADEDCDDLDARVNPGAVEVCDGVDNDCDGVVDPDTSDGALTGYTDADGDGWGDPDAPVSGCELPSGAVSNSDDCDDSRDDISPDGVEVCDGEDNNCDGLVDGDDPAVDTSSMATGYLDLDGDGFGDPEAPVFACTLPEGASTDDSDCDDTRDDVHPDAQEVCDDLDNDCDGLIDDDDDSNDSTSVRSFYADGDGDGYGAGELAFEACEGTPGFVANDTDCDDTDDSIHPAATEVCSDPPLDEDCDGLVDDDDPTVDLSTGSTWYVDTDTDGYGDGSAATVLACTTPTVSGRVHVRDNTDCDDTDSAVNPAATEVCDTDDTDENCDGLADDDDPSVDTATQSSWSPDTDGDGYGDHSAEPTLACDDPSTATDVFVADTQDCDDADSAVNPAATEVCDADDIDENCNGVADDDDATVDTTTQTLAYPDDDLDGYGDDTHSGTLYCDAPTSGWSATADDCDDTRDDVHPGATEMCSDVDEDCDPTTSHAGTVRWVDATGTATDLTSTWTSGATGGSSLAWTSSEDGELWVCAGTWAVALTVDGHAVDLIGPDGSASTILDGLTSAVPLTIASGSEVLVEGITIENGSGTNGGAVAIDDAWLLADDLVVTASSATKGGGIYAHDSVLDLANATVSDNTASNRGAGLYIDDQDGAVGHAFASVTIEGNEAADHGGGLYLTNNPDLVFEDSLLLDNSSDKKGGGAYLNTGSLSFIDCTIDGNHADDDGGGLLVKDTTALTDTDLTGNTADDNGGGAYVEMSTSDSADFSATLSSAPIDLSGNTADADSDGSGRGDALYLKMDSNAPDPAVTITDADFGSDDLRVDADSNTTLTPGNGVSLTCNYDDGCQ